MDLKNFILLTIILTINEFNLIYSSPLSNNLNNLNARIQCEFKDKDGDSLILNCTLVNGLSLSPNQDLSQTSGILINNDLSQSASSSSSSSSVQSLNIRVGMDRLWRTPWESLSINHNIIRAIIWRNSKLSELGEYAFKDLNYLQRVDLSFNKLSSINSDVFNSFEMDLIDLDLSHNLFQQVPHEVFRNPRLQNLESLRLNENPIINLSKKPFEYLKNSLKTLELNYCKIRSIDPNTFDQMISLESISLIGNHLRTLNYLTFKDLTLRSFYVHDNPFVCDCNLRWLIEYLKNVDYQQQIYESQSNGGILFLNSNRAGLIQAQTSKQPFSPFNYIPQLTVAQAAQQYLKCDQPNSLKSKSNFLDINPDSFMCDIHLEFKGGVTEGVYELGEDVLLTCEVYGDPGPDVYWSFGQKPIGKALSNDDDKYDVREYRPIPDPSSGNRNIYQSTNKTSELRIKNIQSSDIGMYACTAEIKGSNNRKHINFNLKQFRSPNAVIGLSNAGDLVINSFGSFMNNLFNYVFNHNTNNKLSQSTLLLLFSIMVSLIVFLLILFLFICWKFNCCCCCCAKKKQKNTKKNIDLMLSKEQEKLLIQNGTKLGHDCLDNHANSQNYTNLANDSSATLLSTNKMSNSIRMAYPTYSQQHDIYANHSLLTTTSTTTGSYLANNHIAIDTSNQTPRYHLLNQQNTMDCYYDDLRYNSDEHQNQSSSPYHRQQLLNQQPGQSYSPIVRRDDPTVPLYATLKPKLGNQQTIRPLNSYVQYSTMHRSTPPLPAPRRGNFHHQSNLQLPPPPPPPPILPPVKPKRTFEYVLGTNTSRDLHSESGAFLLADENRETSSIVEYEHNEYDMNTYKSYTKINRKDLLLLKKNTNGSQMKTVGNNKSMTIGRTGKNRSHLNNNGSTTSLDEEDLDLNDLKDFEDVTFDNLRKPGEENLKQRLERNLKQSKSKNLLDLNGANTNSEQSLLIKSSGSSDKSSSNNNLNTNNTNINTNVNNSNDSPILNNDSPNTNTTSTATISNCNINEKLDENIIDLDGDENKNSKIYEETEI